MASATKFAAFVLSTAVLATFAGNASAAIDISKSATAGVVSFRGQASTTYFGWGSGSFDGATPDKKIDNPAPTIGTTTAGVGFVQNDPSVTIISSTNNIYTGDNPLNITITAPTTGTPGTGFTTLIVQGKTAGGPFNGDLSFASIEGVTPSYVMGYNAAGSQQFFVKYQIPGNATSYPVTITGDIHTSLNNLVVDTQWSSTGYAADFAVTPEPTSIAAIGSLVAGGLVRRRRAM